MASPTVVATMATGMSGTRPKAPGRPPPLPWPYWLWSHSTRPVRESMAARAITDDASVTNEARLMVMRIVANVLFIGFPTEYLPTGRSGE